MESFTEEKFYLVEVIAFILKYLGDTLIDHLSQTIKPLKTTDFDWVITVPSIWDARGKRMMREAAYLVKNSMIIFSTTTYIRQGCYLELKGYSSYQQLALDCHVLKRIILTSYHLLLKSSYLQSAGGNSKRSN